MPHIEVQGIIDASPEEVWKIVKKFAELDQFVEAIAECRVDKSGEGTVRTLVLADGGEVKEQLLSLNNEERELTYSILESPMPIKNYTGTMSVDATDDGRSEFTWSSVYDVPGEHADDIKEALEGLYKLGVEGLKSKISD